MCCYYQGNMKSENGRTSQKDKRVKPKTDVNRVEHRT